MRRKSISSSCVRLKKRRRSKSVHATDRWTHSEWFLSTLDDPFFSTAEFTHVISSTLSLPHILSNPPTRLQLARLRAAMCNAFPGGFATPRRFSSAFLAAEIEELSMYRADARRLMRGVQLLPATDPTTDDPLPQHWWSRYRCPPPLPPQKGTDVLVRTCLPPPFADQPRADISAIESSEINPSKSYRAPFLADTYIRKALFMSLAGEAENFVRFLDDGTEHTVSDLDVMVDTPNPCLEHVTSSPPPHPVSNADRLSPGSARFSFSSSPLPDIDFTRTDAPSQLIQLYASPRPVIISPQRPVEIKSRTADHVECEVDVQQVAETMRLLDRKQELLVALRTLNDAVSSRSADDRRYDASIPARYKDVMQQIEEVDVDLQFLVQPERRANDLPKLTATLSGLSIPQPKFDETPDEKRTEGRSWRSPRHSLAHNGDLAATPVRTTGLQHSSALRPEHLAKNVDFRNATGTALLAKALTRASFAKLHSDHKLKIASPSARADVMECVSACVAVLVRARSTKDYHSIEELIDGIRVRFPENAEAIEAIHEAARSFGYSSSDSQ